MTRIETLVSAVAMVAAGGLGAGAMVYRQATPACSTAQEAGPAVVLPHQPRTVSYFLAHQDELKQRYAECRDNPGMAMSDADCVNAMEANTQASLDRLLSSMPK